MAYKFNPVTGQLDLVGSGGGISGSGTATHFPIFTGSTILGDSGFLYPYINTLSTVLGSGPIHLQSPAGNATITDSERIYIQTGVTSEDGSSSGHIFFITGDCTNTNSTTGRVQLNSGNASLSGGVSGRATLTSGSGYDASGDTRILTGSSNTVSGNVTIQTGSAPTRGTISLDSSLINVSSILDMATNKITGLGDPTLAQDAVTKTYVDNKIAGLSWKQAIHVAQDFPTDGNVSLSSAPSTIDSHTLNPGERILLKNQTDATENGIYEFPALGAGNPLVRTTDADTGPEIVGAVAYIEQGTVNAGTKWVNTNTSITLGSTAITFTVFSSYGTVNGTGTNGYVAYWTASTTLTSEQYLSISRGGTGTNSTSQNFAFIGPTSGSGTPSFRALVAADIPALSYMTGSGTTSFIPLFTGATAVGDSELSYNNTTHILTFNGPAANGTATLQTIDLVAGGSDSTDMTIKTGSVYDGDHSGDLNLRTGDGVHDALSGSLSTGSVIIKSGKQFSGSSAMSGNVYISTGDSKRGFQTGLVNITTGINLLNGTTGGITLKTGGSATGSLGNTGDVTVGSGSSSDAGTTGNITIAAGTTSGTRGKIKFTDGSEGTTGHVWTSTDTVGNGHWALSTAPSASTINLLGSQASPVDPVITDLNFDTATIKSEQVSYQIIDSGGDIRQGTMHIVAKDNTTGFSIIDNYTETAVLGIVFSLATGSGTTIKVQYTTSTANTATVKAQITRF